MSDFVAKLFSFAVAVCVTVFTLALAYALVKEAASTLYSLAEIAPAIVAVAAVVWCGRASYRSAKSYIDYKRPVSAAKSQPWVEGGLPFAPPTRDTSHSLAKPLVYAVAGLVLLGVPGVFGWGIYLSLQNEQRLHDYEAQRLAEERAAEVRSRCIGKKLEEARLRDWRARQKAEAEGRPPPSMSEERLLLVMWDAGPKWCPDGWQTLVQEGE